MGLRLGFPWNEFPPGTSVCDVGGGIGAITMQLAQRYPHLQLKLQDLPERVEQAETEVWPKECPEAIKENRIEFKGMDFFAESPINGCDIYYVCMFPHIIATDCRISHS
jgi:tRNA1(Val) A37 N6-methylase TrmN6